MTDGLLGVLRYQPLEFGLAPLMIQKRRPGAAEQRRKVRPRIGSAHVDDLDALDARYRRFGVKRGRRLSGANSAPEGPLGIHHGSLVDRVRRNFYFDPLAPTGDDRKYRGLRP